MMRDKPIRRIGISTGGGDCPGLNAVIRAATMTAIHDYKWKVIGIKNGLAGLIYPDETMELTIDLVKGIIDEGGTILGTTNRGDPFSWVHKLPDGKTEHVDLSSRLVENFEHLGLDGLISIGGDGSMRIAQRLIGLGIPVVGVPKTIDNDLGATDVTFGFQSAVRTATEALDKLHSTARSHGRVLIVEVMGRESGWIALHSGIAGNAHAILIPEIGFDIDKLLDFLEERQRTEGYSIVIIAEAAHLTGADANILSRAPDGTPRLGGIAHQLASLIADQTASLECRVVVVGHIQRGGSPTEYDRVLATRYGEAAVRLVSERKFGHMTSLQGLAITAVPIADAVGEPKRVRPDGTLVRVARSLGISFGD
jgi:ATP-dependent phosphofructokinase / diphosphate-dependent phosphofructokinase